MTRASERTGARRASVAVRLPAPILPAETWPRCLADVSVALAAALDLDSICDALAALAVPELADWCSVVLAEGEDAPRRLSGSGLVPGDGSLLDELWRSLQHENGQAMLLSDARDEMNGAPVNPLPPMLVQRLGVRSAIVAPLISQGRTLGALCLAMTGSGRAYGARDLALVEDLTRRAALAVHTALVLDAERTARAEAERERDWLRQALDVLPTSIVIADVETGISLRNTASYTIVGQQPGAAEGTQNYYAVRHPDGMAYGRAETPLVRSLRSGEVVQSEAVVVRNVATDRDTPILISSAPLRDASGVISGAVASYVDISSLAEIQSALSTNDARFKALVQHAADIIAVLDEGGLLRFVSPSVERLLGYAPDMLIGTSAFQHVHPEDIPRLQTSFGRVLPETGLHPPIQFRLRHADGSWRRVEATANNLLHDPNVRGVVQHLRDVTERTEAEDALRASEERFRALVQQASDIITVLNADGTIRYISPSVERVLGYTPEEAIGDSVFDDTHPEDADRARAFLRDSLANAGSNHALEMRFRHADGSWRHLEITGTNLLCDPSVEGIVVNARDVTDRKGFEEQLTHLAFHDTLTSLPNRALFLDRLEHALARTERSGRSVAVMLLDLDRFKVINDSLGHGAGDDLLVTAAQRITAWVRPGDTVARFGGDEFTVLLEDVDHPSEAVRVADRIIDALRAPLMLEGREVSITASVGIARSASAHTRPAALLQDADVALYQAKAGGRARAVVFDESMSAWAVERLELETDLRHAVERGEMRVYYQPEVDLGSNQIVGVEALVRWQHPRHGLVPPVEFIPLAEETGLILSIGPWVLEEACRQVRAWAEDRPGEEPLMLSVNLSAREFMCPDMASEVATILRAADFPPECLRLEITESTAMHDAEMAAATLRKLKQLGVRVAIDDFGTGYSSLSYLQQFEVDTLKIDKSFVMALHRDRGAVAIVQAVTALAHALDMDVTAEGIETAEQLASAWASHCDRGQGYYFSKPIPGDELVALLRSGVTRTA